MYDFDKLVDRSNSSSVKYEETGLKFGRNDIMPFWVADMDFKAPDFMIETLVKRAEHGIFGYTKRMPDFYDSIVSWLKTRHDLEVKRENIEYGPGVVFLLNMMVRLFTKPNDKIIIQTPVYYPFFSVVEGNNRRIMENTLVFKDGKYTMDFEDLEAKASDPECTMMILCSPHNPVGRVWTKEELTKVSEICNRNNVLVLADEIHFDLVYSESKHISYASISEEAKANSITCTAPSKTFNIAGLHTAYCIMYNEERLTKYRNALGQLDLNRSNSFSREITQSVYENGSQWVDELVDYLEGNRNYICDFITKNIKGITPHKIEATYLMWLDCSGLGLESEEIEDLFVNKAKLALDCGRWFGKSGDKFMRINFASPRSMLEIAMKNLERAVKELKK